jgi:hypothetical protein
VNQEEVFENLKNYIETRPAPRFAIGILKPSIEFGIVIGGQLNCAVLSKDGSALVEKREANDPSFIFFLEPETVETLAKSATDDVMVVAKNIFTEIVSGHIRIEKRKNISEIFSNNYLDMAKENGEKVSSYLTTQGMLGFMKIAAMIEKLKNNKA